MSSPAFAEDGFLTTSDGVQVYYELSAAPQEHGFAILLHDHRQSYNEWNLFRGFLNQHGWSTLAIDLRGHGASMDGEDRIWEFNRFGPREFRLMHEDADAAFELAKEKSVSQNIWMMGSGLGANIAISYASGQPGIQGVVLLSPGLDHQGIRAKKPVANFKKPLLIASSADDKYSFADSQELFKLASGKPKKFIKLKKAGHGNEMIAKKEILKGAILQWMNKQSLAPTN